MPIEPKNPINDSKEPVRRRRVRGNKFVTKSGETVKIHRTMTEKSIARREAKLARKAVRLRGLPKSRFKRFFWHLHPKRVVKYWFSRDGLIMTCKLAGVGIVASFFVLMGIFAYFRKDLPNLKDISGNNKGGSVRYYDRSGSVLLWEDYDAVKRVPVTEKQISQYMKDATIAIEDRDFYKHGGFNTKGIARAVFNNASGGSTQGGSTITQQLVKLTTPKFDQQSTISRKIKELILSVETERSYSKNEILTAYLNVAPYAGIEYGVESASQAYFHKSAKELGLAESAFLASVPKSPVYYSPYSPLFNKKKLKSRSDYVLDIMADSGKITKQQRDAAKKIDVASSVFKRQSYYANIQHPYFVLAAKNQLTERLSTDTYKQGGWKVTTTIDLDKQKIAEDMVAKQLKVMTANPGFYGFDTAALVAEDITTGQVVSLVGGADFNDKSRDGEINFAQQPLPPGSSFKPYDYTALIESTTNFGAGTVLYDSQGPVPGYGCTDKTPPGVKNPSGGQKCIWDFDRKYPGPITLRYALGGSRNVPAIKAINITGVDKTIEIANKLGLKDEKGNGGYKCFADEKLTIEQQCYPSAGIGDGAYLNLDKHVHGYATISRNGNKIPQTYILKVEDSSNKKIYEWKQTTGEQVVRPDSAYIVADMMSDPNPSYFSTKPHRYKNWKYGIKTGTTNDAKDGWMLGFSTQYAVGVWVGYHTRQVESKSPMEAMTLPIWQGWMNKIHENLPAVDRQKPAGVQTLPAYVIKTHVGYGSIEAAQNGTDLYPSWYQKPSAKAGTKQTYDKVSGKLVTDCTPDLAREERTDGNVNQFSGDIFVKNGASTTEKDDLHKCEDLKPAITLTVTPSGPVGTYKLTATIDQGTHPLSGDKFKGAVTFKIDGQTIDGGSMSIDSPSTVSTLYKSTYDGLKTITAGVTDSVLYSASSSVDQDLVKSAASDSGSGGSTGSGSGSGGGGPTP